MLYALGTPVSFLALLVGFGAAILVRGLVQAWLARGLGSRDFDLRTRLSPDPRRHGDIFGLVAAILGGTGWGRAAPVSGLLGRYAYGRARGRTAVRAATVLLAGPVVAAALGAALIVAAEAAGAPRLAVHQVSPSAAVHGDLFTLGNGPRFLLLAGVSCLAVGIVELFPIPPLDGGVLLLALAPTTPGWQRVRHYADQNWGIGVLLLLLIIPVGRRDPVLLVVVDAIGRPLVRLLSS